MAELTPTNRYVMPLGPIKMEVMNLEDVDDADTVVASIQRPLFGYAVMYTDGGAMTAAINPDISGRTITLNSADLTGVKDIVLTVFGF